MDCGGSTGGGGLLDYELGVASRGGAQEEGLGRGLSLLVLPSNGRGREGADGAQGDGQHVDAAPDVQRQLAAVGIVEWLLASQVDDLE